MILSENYFILSTVVDTSVGTISLGNSSACLTILTEQILRLITLNNNRNPICISVSKNMSQIYQIPDTYPDFFGQTINLINRETLIAIL